MHFPYISTDACAHARTHVRETEREKERERERQRERVRERGGSCQLKIVRRGCLYVGIVCVCVEGGYNSWKLHFVIHVQHAVCGHYGFTIAPIEMVSMGVTNVQLNLLVSIGRNTTSA